MMAFSKMNQLIDRIVRPGLKQLIIFGLLISPFLIIVVHCVSFSWMMEDIMTIGLYVVLVIGFIIAFLIDLFRKTKLKAYVLVATALLSAFFVLLYSSKGFLERKSEAQGIILGETIERYKLGIGTYPENLEDEFFNDSPKFAFVGSRFCLASYSSDTTCYITFYSFHGYTRCYNVKTKQWHSYD